MIPKPALVSLFFAIGAYGAPLDSGLNFEPVIRETLEAQHVIKQMTSLVQHNLDPPPRVDRKRQAWTGRKDIEDDDSGCFYQRQQLIAAADGIDIGIIAHEDFHIISGSSATPIDITTSEASVDTTSSGWRIEGTETMGGEASASFGFGGFGASLSLSYSHSQTRDKSDEASKQLELRRDVSITRECPRNTACSVQTWTYVVKLTGTCPVVPIGDPVCWEKWTKDGNDPNNFRFADPFSPFKPLNLLKEKKVLSGNLSLPSINEQDDAWTGFGRDFYTMSKKDGSPAGKVLPSKFVDGVWWASEDEYKIEYKDNKACDMSFPLLKSGQGPDGKLQLRRTQVMIEKPIQRRDLVSRADDGEPKENGIKVTILSNDIDD
ncbi:hypothetical protein HIM_11860 [Hirsutella minnesotensis 3608]|uniref:Uncharacterized protein n=1 Tax=Hirsutella minnesotensis 3608 TaxID=1043627 RepID=A0A0F7ZF95_9HYPO|nr:hypothetical protein HIM_11860 [Hirsutella minnesotensis 3608]